MPQKVAVYNQKGEKVKDITLNPAVFAVKVNSAVIHQVVVSMQSSARQNLAHTKDRGDVSGGGRKPWRQKGTGRARHGSNRSPLWIGGGVTFGPTKDINFQQKVNKKMRRKALLMALSDRSNTENISVVDQLTIAEGKTKGMVQTLNNLKLSQSVLVIIDAENTDVVRSAANLPSVEVIAAKNLNPVTVLKYRHLVMAETALSVIEKTFLSADKRNDQKPAAEKESTKKLVQK
ncbi:TPA: 50S ribosomal protein L4 [Candidatus Falkowbacteria bacterium]|nr:50S ribosomal protein L4 [Candidatus Falkowbacteria bacterium]